MEIIGIPKTVESKDFEHNVCKVFNSFGFIMGEDRIEACHQLTKSDRTIVKYSRRKDCEHLMGIKKGLKYLNPTNLSFPEGTEIYVNDRGLWNEYKKLWNNKKVSTVIMI